MKEAYIDPKDGKAKWREKEPESEPPVRVERLVRCPEHARHHHACPICARVRVDRPKPMKIRVTMGHTSWDMELPPNH